MSLVNYVYFLLFCAAIVFSPGPMTMLLMSIGMQHGLKKTMPAQLGASSAYCISLLIFAVGLTSLLSHYTIVLRFIRYVGVAYIIYLAYKQWQNGANRDILSGLSKRKFNPKPSHLFYMGMLTGLSNPKTIVMFSTVIPQFAHKSATKIFDLAMLSLIFLVLQFLSGVTYSYFGQQIKSLLERSSYRSLFYKLMTVVLLLVAVMLARI